MVELNLSNRESEIYLVLVLRISLLTLCIFFLNSPLLAPYLLNIVTRAIRIGSKSMIGARILDLSD